MLILFNLLIGLWITDHYKSVSAWLDECPDPSGVVITMCLIAWPVLLWRVWYVSFKQGREHA